MGTIRTFVQSEKYAEYTPQPGEHIQHAAEAMCDLSSREKLPVLATFNNIQLTARPGQTPADIVSMFDADSERLRVAYHNSPEGKKAALELAQATIDRSIADLNTLNLADLRGVIQWFDSIQDASDLIGVEFDRNAVVKRFESHGYFPNVNCGPQFRADDADNSARWLIGQALGNLQTVGAIHPMYREFAKQWRDKFSQA